MEINMRVAICDDCLDDISVIHDILTANKFTGSGSIDTYTSSEKLLQALKQNIKYEKYDFK